MGIGERMSHVVAIANLAGGTTKTTTVRNLAVAFAEYGKKVLVVDVDPKSDFTFALGGELSRVTISELLSRKSPIDSGIVSTSERFDYIPGSSSVDSFASASAFNHLMGEFASKYDLVVLDTPSTPTQGLFMALEVADSILYPMPLTNSSFRGAHRIRTIVKDKLQMAFIKLDGFRNLVLEKEIAADFDLLDCEILESQDLRENENSSSSVLVVSKNSPIAGNYRELAYSILEKLHLI